VSLAVSLSSEKQGEIRPGSDALEVRWATYEELDALDMNPVVRKNMQHSFEVARELGFSEDKVSGE